MAEVVNSGRAGGTEHGGQKSKGHFDSQSRCLRKMYSGKEALDSQHCKCWESYVWRGTSTSNRGKDPNTFCSADTVAEDAMFSIWAWNWKLHPSRSSYWQIFRRDVLHYVSSKQKERKQQPQTTQPNEPRRLVVFTLFSLISTLPREFSRSFSFFKRG